MSRGLCWLGALGLGLVLALPCATAHAATPVESVTQLRTLFSELSVSIDRFAAGNSGLVELGRRTAVALFGVLLVWGMIRSWVLGRGWAQLLPEFIQPLLVLALALWAVDHLGPVVRDSVQGLSSVFAQTLGLEAGSPDEVDVLQRLAGAGFDLVAAAPTSGGESWLEALKAIADQTVGFLFRLAAAFLLLLAGGLAAGVMVLAKIQTALAVLFAPVMIPWAMWQPSVFLFNAWLGFLIGGAMQGVMAAAMASLSVTLVDKLVALAVSVRTDDNVSYVTYSVIVLMSALIAYLFTRVPSLAAALVGGASLGVDRWSAVSVRAQRPVSQAGAALVGVARDFDAGRRKGMAWVQGTAAPGRGTAAATATTRPSLLAGTSAASLRRGRGHVAGRSAGAAPAWSSKAAGLSGLAFGAMVGAAARTMGRGSSSVEPDLPVSPGYTSPASKQPHKPFRPKSGTRPVNRPLRRV